MPRPLKWYSKIKSIKESAERSKNEVWDRRNIEALFDVSRASAQTIMKAIGGIENISRVYTISRADLLAYLERMDQAEDPSLEHNKKIENHAQVPRAEKVLVPLPSQLKAVMVRDLPEGIVLESGHLAFFGNDYEQILELVGAFLMACRNDPDTVIASLNPPSKAPEKVDDELRSLFANLRAREQAHADSRPSVCMDDVTGALVAVEEVGTGTPPTAQ